MTTKTVGKFTLCGSTLCGSTLCGSTLTGPAAYMAEQGNALVARIERGGDVVTGMFIDQCKGDIEQAILVRLQTDYAGWHGSKAFFAGLGR